MARDWKKEFNAQFTRKGNTFTFKDTGQKISLQEYRRLFREASLADKKINKPWSESEGVNPKDWWKSPWIINRLTNSNMIDPNNPNRYLNMAEYQEYMSNIRREELEIGIAQAKMNKANEDSFKPGGINYKGPPLKIKAAKNIKEENNFSEAVDNGVSVDGQSEVPLAIEGLNSPGTKKLTTGTSPESSGGVTEKPSYWRNEAARPDVWARKWAGGDGKTLEEVNKNTVNWLKQEGYDVSAIPKHKLKNLLADVRLDRVFTTRGTKGDFLHHDGHIIKRKPKKSNENK